jgi:hypothetical protein
MTNHEINRSAEVYLTDRSDVVRYHQVKILESGWVLGINEASYEAHYHPPRKVQRISTHTSDEQEDNFVTKEVAADD